MAVSHSDDEDDSDGADFRDVVDDGVEKVQIGGMDGIPTGDMNTISMDATVDVSGMDDEQKEVLSVLARMYEEAFTEVVNKNRGYGFSFIESGVELARRDGGPVDNSTRGVALGLFTRSGDKRSRFYQRLFNERGGGSSDPVHQTALENSNYWMFMSLVTREPDLVERLIK